MDTAVHHDLVILLLSLGNKLVFSRAVKNTFYVKQKTWNSEQNSL